VGGDALAAREAGLVEQQRAGADAGHEPAARAHLAQPLDQHRVRDLAPGALPARNEHHVEGRSVREGVIGEHTQALGTAHQAALLGDRDHAVCLLQRGGGGEHLVGSREVELLRVVEEQDAGRDAHAVPLARRRARARPILY
jgi:hypothetical protein